MQAVSNDEQTKAIKFPYNFILEAISQTRRDLLVSDMALSIPQPSRGQLTHAD